MATWSRSSPTDLTTSQLFDEHWTQLTGENNEVARHGTINSVAENLRKTRMMAQNKMQRSQINVDRMESTAINQFKRIKNNSDLIKMYKI